MGSVIYIVIYCLNNFNLEIPLKWIALQQAADILMTAGNYIRRLSVCHHFQRSTYRQLFLQPFYIKKSLEKHVDIWP